MELELNKSYLTRDGRKATIESIGHEDLAYPVYAEVDGALYSYDTNGCYFGDVKSDLDLIGEWGFDVKPLDFTIKDKHLEIRKEGDRVNHPSHYTQGVIETIDYMESCLTPEEFCGGCKMNVLKYVSREKFKNGVEDLKKAQWYLDRLIDYLEKQGAAS